MLVSNLFLLELFQEQRFLNVSDGITLVLFTVSIGNLPHSLLFHLNLVLVVELSVSDHVPSCCNFLLMMISELLHCFRHILAFIGLMKEVYFAGLLNIRHLSLEIALHFLILTELGQFYSFLLYFVLASLLINDGAPEFILLLLNPLILISVNKLDTYICESSHSAELLPDTTSARELSVAHLRHATSLHVT